MTQRHQIRVLRPFAHIYAFYEGRIDGHRFALDSNWVDDGALSLGIASYAIVSENEALIYDTHLSVDRAAFIRKTLEALGVDTFVVVLSHWHLDHIAGTSVFADSTIIANKRTAELMAKHRSAIETGSLHGLPAIDPLIAPTHLFECGVHLHIGKLHIDLIQCNIHSDDATVVHLKSDGILLVGDCIEDCVTYVSEPEHLARHLTDLDRLAALAPKHILPNHGHPDKIASGGYGVGTILATSDYLWKLIAARTDPKLQVLPLEDWLRKYLDSGDLHWFAAYEAVHKQNLARVIAADLY
jgi:glyoxylase-like metal-dependent hydrolase (beta-lactamase superfamily II)